MRITKGRLKAVVRRIDQSDVLKAEVPNLRAVFCEKEYLTCKDVALYIDFK